MILGSRISLEGEFLSREVRWPGGMAQWVECWPSILHETLVQSGAQHKQAQWYMLVISTFRGEGKRIRGARPSSAIC